MDGSQNGKLEKYFQAIFFFILFFLAVILLYRQFVYLPHQKEEYLRLHTPQFVEERSYFTSEENTEMRKVYEELMLKKYGKKVDITQTPSGAEVKN